MNTNTVTDRVITIDYSMSPDDMIAAGEYHWKNEAITAKRFAPASCPPVNLGAFFKRETSLGPEVADEPSYRREW
jgi:hypothetical protein